MCALLGPPGSLSLRPAWPDSAAPCVLPHCRTGLPGQGNNSSLVGAQKSVSPHKNLVTYTRHPDINLLHFCVGMALCRPTLLWLGSWPTKLPPRGLPRGAISARSSYSQAGTHQLSLGRRAPVALPLRTLHPTHPTPAQLTRARQRHPRCRAPKVVPQQPGEQQGGCTSQGRRGAGSCPADAPSCSSHRPTVHV